MPLLFLILLPLLLFQLSADREREALETFVRESGEEIKIEAWDWRYYAEKVRTVRHSEI